ncbi:arginine decarboxylase [Sulfurifustis variabilis]|uniref:Biosynthetic arginine decarboxylase n=1 Tax=Sulfurifustis variabilis TaxID=1675686 RepID=A0A1B4UZQ5_9GAMM|nr:biosynthetic arginine decarboxylase [Sulfurifustis variabilis]BAU46626.1 arginine decarboxylase [Sulfurifustis variabilis]
MSWSSDKARETYNIPYWGSGYFDVSAQGHVVARPDPGAAGTIDLYELARSLPAHDLTLPVLVRFSGILQHRVRALCAAFDRATAALGYRGRYTAVYPIKVNQQSSVVEALLAQGGDRIGLEAGSKPELLAVLARSHEGGIVVCNGYKDREYIRLALIGRRLGHRVYIVVEKLSEIELVIEEARALSVEPLLGVRVRLASLGAGKWQNTGGEKSKFGLSAAELLRVIERLRAAGMIDALRMMHFHMGSQIANIRHVQAGVREAGRYYAELRRAGAPVDVVNVGGGLGVDYEGTRSRSFCSMNYSIDEYAHNIVHALADVCAELHLPHPDVVTESGRAMTAHHAVLVTNVIDLEQAPGLDRVEPAGADEPVALRNLSEVLENVAQRSPLEAYHDAAYWLNEAQGMFAHGVLDLAGRARAERMYFAICRRVRERLQPGARAHREVLDELNEKLADKYFLNFSLFQSVPDHWAIEQIFPVVPLHRLDEPPTRRTVLQDITCDSDGRLDWYVDGDGVETSLPLHELKPGEPYLVGIFLVGAYQEILGDMHNLFGDTDSVHVDLGPDGSARLTQALRGDTVDDVLRYVHFDPTELLAAYRRKIDGARGLTPAERESYLDALAQGLKGYTYLEE